MPCKVGLCFTFMQIKPSLGITRLSSNKRPTYRFALRRGVLRTGSYLVWYACTYVKPFALVLVVKYHFHDDPTYIDRDYF